jgi:ribose-phosphate pyrophosphokinase
MENNILIFEKSKLLKFGTDWGINSFPDNQNQFWILNEYENFTVRMRINSPQLIDLAVQMTATWGCDELQVTYFYGARSDKAIADNRNVSDTAYIYTRILGERLHQGRLKVLDPHFDTEGYKIKNYEVDWTDLIKENKIEAILFPDYSAKFRYEWVKKLDIPQYYCLKKRDQVTSKIISQVIPEIKEKSILVIDDLCDSGNSFLKLACNLKDKNLYLAITHGVFSFQAIPKLKSCFKKILVTNSYQNLDTDDQLFVYDVFNNENFFK